MQTKSFIVVLGLVMAIALVAGCTSEDDSNGGTGNGNGVTEPLNGTYEYTGIWTGTWLGSAITGTFELTVNFDTGKVIGTMNSGYPGAVSGTISERMMNANGTVATYAVTWTGAVDPDGAGIAGDWQCDVSEVGSGTWAGAT